MPRLTIDLGKIEENARLVANLLKPCGVRLVGVTKACLGNALVGQAMLAGGAAALADSRCENIANLRRHLPEAELHLMRSPVGGGVTGEPDLYFVSSADQARALRDACHDGVAGARLDAFHDGVAGMPRDAFHDGMAGMSRDTFHDATAGMSRDAFHDAMPDTPPHSGPGADIARPRRDLRLCLLVETGDGREGVPADQVADEAERIFDLDGVELAGLATNAACARMPASLDDTLKSFYQSSARGLWRLGKKGVSARRRQAADHRPVTREPSPDGRIPPFSVMSIGGSGFLRLLIDSAAETFDGSTDLLKIPPLGAVTELRSGEAILLGRVPAAGLKDIFFPGAHRDAFLLAGEVLEVYPKHGATQALLDFGLQDIGAGRLIPRRQGVSFGAATSDYLAVSFPAAMDGRPLCADNNSTIGVQQTGVGDRLMVDGQPLRVGDRLTFIPTYYALLAAMTSPFVEKVFI